jgi:PEP-CTERM motif
MRFRLFLATIMVAASTGVASASPITYTATFTGSGSLGGVSYTNQLITLTGIGNTADVTSDSFGDFFNAVTATVQIGSGSVEAFTDSIELIGNSVGAAFTDGTLGDVVIEATSGASIDNYELQSAVTGTGDSVVAFGSAFQTAVGDFVIDDAAQASTFSATLPTAATPEPSSFVFLGTGILGLAGVARRKLLRP